MIKLNPHELKAKFEHNTIFIDGEPYLTRYYVSGKNPREIGAEPALFIHQFHKSDQPQELHNHPYTGKSFILSGGYRHEIFTADGYIFTSDYLPGDVNELNLDDFHRTTLFKDADGVDIECWTVFVTGERVQKWGFIDRDSREYFPYMSESDEREGEGPHARNTTRNSQSARLGQKSRQRVQAHSLVEPVVITFSLSDMDEASFKPSDLNADAVDAEFWDEEEEEDDFPFTPALALGTLVELRQHSSYLRHPGVYVIVELDYEDSNLTYRIQHTDGSQSYGLWVSLHELDIHLEPEPAELDVQVEYPLPVRTFGERLFGFFV